MEVRLPPNIPVGCEWSAMPIPGYPSTPHSYSEGSRSTTIPARSSHSPVLKYSVPCHGPRSTRSFLKPISCLLEGSSYCKSSGSRGSKGHTWRAGDHQMQGFVSASTMMVPYHFLPYKNKPSCLGNSRHPRLGDRRIGRIVPRDSKREGSLYQGHADTRPSHISEDHLVVGSSSGACSDYDGDVYPMDSTLDSSRAEDVKSTWSTAHARVGMTVVLNLESTGRRSDESGGVSRGFHSPPKEIFPREPSRSTSSFAADTSTEQEDSCPGQAAVVEEDASDVRSSSPVIDGPTDPSSYGDHVVRKLRRDGRCPPAASSEASRRSSCRSAGCTRHPRYAKPGEKAEFCSVHKLDGYVDVKHPRCEASDGCVKQPTFGWESEKARFCAAHKLPGMRDVKNPRCAAPGCLKRPRYGDEGERARFCAAHKLGRMVDMASKRDVKCSSPPKRARDVSRSVPRVGRARSFDDPPVVRSLLDVGVGVGVGVGSHKRSKSEGWAEDLHLKLEESEHSEGRGALSDRSYSKLYAPQRNTESPDGEAAIGHGASASPTRQIGGRVLDAKEFETCAILLECHSQARVDE